MADRSPPSIQDRLKALKAQGAPPSDPGPPADAPQSGWLPDPVKHIAETVTPVLDRAGLLPQPGMELRTLGGLVIPQNTTEAALSLMLAGGQPEGLLAKAGAKYALPALERLTASGLSPAIARAALKGVTTGGVAKATGSGAPGETAAYAAGGAMFGEYAGKALSGYQQSRAAKLGLGSMTEDVADWLRSTVGRWLPQKEGSESAERVIRAVWSGEAREAVGAELGKIKAANAKTPVKVMDLKPAMTEAGVVFEMPGAKGPAPTVQGGMVWPPVREFETPVGPGTAMERYGAVARRQGALPAGEVPLGEALAAIEQAKAKLTASKTMLPVERDIRLGQLGTWEEELTTRADPRYAALLKEWGRTLQLQELFNVEAGSLFDGRTGRLSWDGYTALAQRLGKRDPRLFSFSPEETNRLGKALSLDLERGGMVWGQPGRGPLRGGSVGISRAGLPHASIQAPQFAWLPNWEQTAGPMRAKLAPAAIRAITGQIPAHVPAPPDEGPKP